MIGVRHFSGWIAIAAAAGLAAGVSAPALAAPQAGSPAAGSITLKNAPSAIASIPAAGSKAGTFWISTENNVDTVYAVVEINESTLAQTSFSVPIGTYQLAADPDLGLVWALSEANSGVTGSENALTELSTAGGTPKTLSLSGIAAAPTALTVDPAAHTVYVLDVNGDVYAINESAPAVPSAPLIRGAGSSFNAGAIGVDSSTGDIWVTSENNNDVLGYSQAGASLGSPVPVGTGPGTIAVDSARGTVWVGSSAGTVSEFAEDATSKVSSVPLTGGGVPSEVVVNGATGDAWVSETNQTSYSLQELGGSSPGLLASYLVGSGGLSGVALDPGSGQVWSISGQTYGTPNVFIEAPTKPAVTSTSSAWFATNYPGNNSFQFTSSGFPAPTYSETGALPRGVKLDDATGVLAGNPATTGTYSIHVKAKNAEGTSAAATFTLRVGSAPVFAGKASAYNFVFYRGVKEAVQLHASSDPACEFGSALPLPKGLSLSPTGLLSGTAAKVLAQTTEVFEAKNIIALTPIVGSIKVLASHPAKITSAGRWTVHRGRKASFTIRATGAPLPGIRVQGKLPRGLRLKAGRGDAVISGTVSRSAKPGTYKVKVTASNGAGRAAVQTLTITVR
jgi:DNA-binding beta-propeller fold protein YncE